jgi:hypothetical protein
MSRLGLGLARTLLTDTEGGGPWVLDSRGMPLTGNR